MDFRKIWVDYGPEKSRLNIESDQAEHSGYQFGDC